MAAIEPAEINVGSSDGPAEPALVRVTLDWQLAVVAEMVGELQTLTFAGQAHNMAKIVAFIDHAGSRILRRLSTRNQQTFAQLLADLELESQRRLPDAAQFRRRADNLLALLVAAAGVSRAATEKVTSRTLPSGAAMVPPTPGSTTLHDSALFSLTPAL